MTGSSGSQPRIEHADELVLAVQPDEDQRAHAAPSRARRTTGARGRSATGPLTTWPTGVDRADGRRLGPRDGASRSAAMRVGRAVRGQDADALAVRDDDRAAGRAGRSRRGPRGRARPSPGGSVARRPTASEMTVASSRSTRTPGRHVALDADDPDRLAVRAVDARQDGLADELVADEPSDPRAIGHATPPRARGQGQGPGAGRARALADDGRVEQARRWAGRGRRRRGMPYSRSAAAFHTTTRRCRSVTATASVMTRAISGRPGQDLQR